MIDTLPPLQSNHYIYREARWVNLVLVGAITCFAFGIVALAVVSMAKVHPLLTALAFVGAATLAYFILFLRSTDNAINFVATETGLYFPERKFFKRTAETWLFVPWKNVIDYRVQLLFDETSSRGLVFELVATREEESRYFTGCRMFRQAAAQYPKGRPHTILIGYSTFLPRPRNALVSIRKLDALPRREEETQPALNLLGQEAGLLHFH